MVVLERKRGIEEFRDGFLIEFTAMSDTELVLKVWGVVGPLLALLVGRSLKVADARKKADIKLFSVFRDALPHAVYRNFIDDTWNMTYNAEYLNTYLDTYHELSQDPINRFNDPDLQRKHEQFAKAQRELLMAVSTEFGFPGNRSGGRMNLQCVAPHGSERYERVSQEIIQLNNDLESTYDAYVAAARKKLSLEL